MTILEYDNEPYGLKVQYPYDWIIRINSNYSLPSTFSFAHPQVICSFYLPNRWTSIFLMYGLIAIYRSSLSNMLLLYNSISTNHYNRRKIHRHFLILNSLKQQPKIIISVLQEFRHMKLFGRTSIRHME